MKKTIDNWQADSSEKINLGELVIDGGYIEFHSQEDVFKFPKSFYTNSEFSKTKVFVKCLNDYSNIYKTLEKSRSYEVDYVLLGDINKDIDISKNVIKSFSFTFDELARWLQMKTVDLKRNNEEYIIKTNSMENIILKECNPKIEIIFENVNTLHNQEIDSDLFIGIGKMPKILVTNEEVKNIEALKKDIECLREFFGLMNGYLFDLKEIEVNVLDFYLPISLYLNKNYSYNLNARNEFEFNRTNKDIVLEKIRLFFEGWYNFCELYDYNLIRSMYFSINNGNSYSIEELFITYVRLLEGFHLRENKDEEIAINIRKEFKKIANEVLNEHSLELIKNTFEECGVTWNGNKNDKQKFSEWIASGYLNKISLKDRILYLDKKYLVLKEASKKIISDDDQGIDDSKDIDEQKYNIFVQRIANTRNYFAHAKVDDLGVLSYGDIVKTLKPMKLIIKGLFLSKMMVDNTEENESVIRILKLDQELRWIANKL